MKQEFSVTWLSQTLVIFSVVLVIFSAGIVVYNETGSLISFSLIILCGYVPEILIVPFVGSLVDKAPRKAILLTCSIAQAIVFFSYALALIQDDPVSEIVYFIISISSAVAGVHRLAYNSSIVLFSKDPSRYPRLNGLVQSGIASAHIFAPLVAGLLLEFADVWVVAITAAFACSLAALSLFPITFPELERRRKSGSWSGMKIGVNHIRQSQGLKYFLGIHAFSNFARGASIVLFTPLILSFSSEAILGGLRSTAGLGMAVGSLAMASWSGSIRHLPGVLFSLGFCGVMIATIGLTQNLVVIGLGTFLLYLATPVLTSLAHAVWQHQVPIEVQGRVFGIRDSVAGAALVSGYVVSPWMASSISIPFPGIASDGLGETYFLMGLITIVLAIAAYKCDDLWMLEK